MADPNDEILADQVADVLAGKDDLDAARILMTAALDLAGGDVALIVRHHPPSCDCGNDGPIALMQLLMRTGFSEEGIAHLIRLAATEIETGGDAL